MLMILSILLGLAIFTAGLTCLASLKAALPSYTVGSEMVYCATVQNSWLPFFTVTEHILSILYWSCQGTERANTYSGESSKMAALIRWMHAISTKIKRWYKGHQEELKTLALLVFVSLGLLFSIPLLVLNTNPEVATGLIAASSGVLITPDNSKQKGLLLSGCLLYTSDAADE